MTIQAAHVALETQAVLFARSAVVSGNSITVNIPAVSGMYTQVVSVTLYGTTGGGAAESIEVRDESAAVCDKDTFTIAATKRINNGGCALGSSSVPNAAMNVVASATALTTGTLVVGYRYRRMAI